MRGNNDPRERKLERFKPHKTQDVHDIGGLLEPYLCTDVAFARELGDAACVFLNRLPGSLVVLSGGTNVKAPTMRMLYTYAIQKGTKDNSLFDWALFKTIYASLNVAGMTTNHSNSDSIRPA